MRRLIVKIHLYAGLLSFAHLAVYGIAGLAATVQPSLERPKQIRSERQIPYTAPANATDKQVAADVYTKLKLPLTRPIPDWFLQRTPAGDLQLDFYNINGIWRVIVLERESRLRIEEIRNSMGLFLEDVHAATLGDRDAPALLRLWAVWNEFAMWTLLGFCGSGVYLWLASRPRWWPAHIAWVCGAAMFAGLWWSLR